MTRAFVAVVPPPRVLERVAEVAAAARPLLPPDARMARPEQWHLTLRFLPDVDLDAATEALCSLDLTSEEVGLGGFGAFPRRRRANVLWLGVAAGSPWLLDIAAQVGDSLEPLAGAETRRFRPHLTLARLRAATDLRSPITALAEVAGPLLPVSWKPVDVVLIESRVSPAGAHHRQHASFGLH